MIITKERDGNEQGSSSNEFPRLILEQENISKAEAEKVAQKTLSTREIITFLLFCIFYICIVYMQISVTVSYDLNSSVLSAVNKRIHFEDIQIDQEYWAWFKGFVVDFYEQHYYANYSIPEYKQHALPNFNVLLSPLRITQRRMELVPNTDFYTRDYILEGWASLGFGIKDSFDSSVESDDSFANGLYNYSKEGTFSEEGGFLQLIDIISIDQSSAIAQAQALESNDFIDKQTRSIVIDFYVYNPYADTYVVTNLIAIFEANGMIEADIDIYDIKRDYYGTKEGIIRFVLEILFVILLVFYFIMEILEIVNDIKERQKDLQNKEDHDKKVKKEEGGDKEEQKKENEEQFEKSPDEPGAPVNKKSMEKEKTIEKEQQPAEGCCSSLNKVMSWFKFVFGGVYQHYADGWNWIDTLFLSISLVAIVFWSLIMVKHFSNIDKVESGERNAELNESFYEIGRNLLRYQRLISLNFILIFIKVLKYLSSWFERVMIIFKTLSYAKSDIFYFLIMYVIIFFAFVVMCHIYYGADLTDFGTIINSLITLFQMLLGNLDILNDMILLNKLLSFFFFIAFMTSMQFILINMFIAFISNAYSSVNEIEEDKKERFDEELKQKHWLIKLEGLFLSLKARCACKKKPPVNKYTERNVETIKSKIGKNMFDKIQKDKLQADEKAGTAEPQKINLVFEMGNENQLNLHKSDDTKSDSNKKIITSSKNKEVDDSDGDSQDQNREQVRKAKEKQEKEKAKFILTRRDWDKNFDQDQFLIEEPMAPALLSEKQDDHGQKERQYKCGKIMWASISFTVYAGLYISLILMQLNVERNYWYNNAIKNVIESLSYQSTLSGSHESIESIVQYQDLTDWLYQSVPQMAQQITQEQTQFTGYYIQTVNYILGDKFRLCFLLSKRNPDFMGDVFEPQYLKSFDEQDIILEDEMVGESSGYTYQLVQDGYGGLPSYCMDVSFYTELYMEAIDRLINDRIISDQLLLLSMEFVTFEASQSVHTYSQVQFNFPFSGQIEYKINIFTMLLNQYKTVTNLVRLGLECLYIVLLLYNIFIFMKKVLRKNTQYRRFYKVEIDCLSDIEKKQRRKKRPEFLRKCDALFTAFTYFDMMYFSLALTSIIIWVLFIIQASVVNFELPPSEENSNFIPEFQRTKDLLVRYTNVVAINTIFLSVKVFDYMNKSKHMKMLSNTLYMAKEDTLYFLIIFTIFLFGFVGMSFTSFGSYLSGYNTIGSAIRSCFEITIGAFDYNSLYKANPPMAVIFFFPFNILFVFILTNIFLAIINESYEKNQLSKDDEDGINLLRSIFYCFINIDKHNNNKKKAQGIDQKAGANDYLEVFEKQVVNLQISVSDLKTWATNCADEIKSELKKRTQLRMENREILLNKFKKMKAVEEGKGGTGVASSSRRFDEIECYRKRLQYWDYIRNGIQFISFQNKVLEAFLQNKEKEIQEKTQIYYREKEKTQEIYKYLALLEKPVEDRLEEIMNYRKLLKMLEEEKEHLIKMQDQEQEEEDRINQTEEDKRDTK